MIKQIGDFSYRKIALLAGIGYLIIFITGFFSNFIILESLVVPGDAATTAHNIQNNEMLFRWGFLSFFIMVILDILLAWLLYLLLKPVNSSLSLLSGWLRIVNGSIFGIALYKLLDVLSLLNGDGYLGAFPTDQLQAHVMLSIEAFNHTWLIGLVFFGLHLYVLGYLIFKSGFIPMFIGILLIAASVGYLVDSFANFLLSNYDQFKDIFMLIVVIPGIIGELSFTIWLLWKGTKFNPEAVKL